VLAWPETRVERRINWSKHRLFMAAQPVSPFVTNPPLTEAVTATGSVLDAMVIQCVWHSAASIRPFNQFAPTCQLSAARYPGDHRDN
jgi:hypothetical protein